MSDSDVQYDDNQSGCSGLWGCLTLCLLIGGVAFLINRNVGLAILIMGCAVPLSLFILAIPTIFLSAFIAIGAHWAVDRFWGKRIQMPMVFLIGVVPLVIYGIGVYVPFTISVVGVGRYVVTHLANVPFLVFGAGFLSFFFVQQSFYLVNGRMNHNGRGAVFLAGTIVTLLCVGIYFLTIFKPSVWPAQIKMIPYAEHIFQKDTKELEAYAKTLFPLIKANRAQMEAMSESLSDRLAKVDGSSALVKAALQVYADKSEGDMASFYDRMAAIKPPAQLKAFHETYLASTKEQIGLLHEFRLCVLNDELEKLGDISKRMMQAEAQATLNLEKSLKDSGLEFTGAGPELQEYMKRKAKGI